MNSATGKTEREEELQTIIFNAFVFCQVFNEINARKPDAFNVYEGLLTNKLFLNVMAFTCIMQVHSQSYTRLTLNRILFFFKLYIQKDADTNGGIRLKLSLHILTVTLILGP